MKATGIVRRIDDLGRIVLPKELRKTMGINEKDPLEIFVDNQSIILRKYNATAEVVDVVSCLKRAISDNCDLPNRQQLIEKAEEIDALLLQGRKGG